jgi:hypothetical protein
MNVELAEKPFALVIVTVYVPGFSNGTVTSVSTTPLLEALGAGLGRADAEPISRTVTVPRELNPIPLIVITSSTEAVDGLIMIDGLGVLKVVVVPVISPTFASTM